MSEPGKAVFLSYASQDAEAAKRICDALRAAGVEVWFDQDELAGGDAWDAKIRGQIGSCALFLPVVSAATQARREGYFRIEWKIAAQRTHAMADGTPFLLPLLIDETRDAEALVPGEFRGVQWTKLPGGETPPAFAGRVQKLLTGEMGAGSPRPAERGAGEVSRRSLSKWWWVPAIFGVSMALLLVLKEGRKDPPPPAPGATATPAVSEARKLVAQARALYEEGDETNHETLSLAEDLLNKAQVLDSTDAEVWAAQAHVSRMMGLVGYEMSMARRTLLQKQAERAIQLDPGSINAKVAYAMFLTDAGGKSALEAARQLHALEADHPGNRDLLQAEGIAYSVGGTLDESSAAFDRANALLGGDARALAQKGAQLVWYGRYAEAAAALDGSLAIRGTGRAYVLGTMLQLCWQGDLDGAAASLEKWPAWLLLEPRGATIASQIWLWRHEPDKAVAVLNALPRDSWNDVFFTGPKSVLLALAHEMAGRAEAAHAEWENTVKVAGRMLAEDPLSPEALAYKACALARLGDKAAAETTLRALEQSGGLRAQFWSCAPSSALLRLAAGHGDDIAAKFDTELRVPRVKATFPSPQAALRLNPVFDSIRTTPSFQKWLVAAPAPKAPREIASPAPIARVDEKSVAVLAFANLSDDKANEYFSDGISEELLNVLAKVPGLKVTARTSSFHFKGKDTPIPEIARQLGVAYVVEGSVRKAGTQVRITAQLIKADGGFHVWSDTFTRDIKDVFAVQDEIAGLIARNLRAKMALDRERAAVAPEAYALVLQARQAAAGQTINGGREAVKLYREALALAPAAADAWAELAYAYQYLARFGGMDTGEGMREARLAARKALELDPEQPLGLAAFGWVQRTDEHDWRGAVQSFRHALAAAPESVAIMSDAAICFLNVGLIDEAIVLADRAVERDPLNPKAHWTRGIVLAFAGKLAQAEAPYRRAIELAPAADEYHSHLARVLTVLHRLDEAKAVALAETSERYRLSTLAGVYYNAGDKATAERFMAELIAKYGDSMAGYIATIYAQAGQRDEAFKWLERAYESRDSAVAWVKSSAYLEELHDDPRWPVFLHKMGLADEQLK